LKPVSNVIFFPCRDIFETKRYYAEVLELPVYKDLGHTVWFDSGYGYLAFVEYDPPREMASGACISFNMASEAEVDAVYKMLSEKAAIGLQSPPKKHPRFPVYSFFLSDPNGYLLEYQKTLD